MKREKGDGSYFVWSISILICLFLAVFALFFASCASGGEKPPSEKGSPPISDSPGAESSPPVSDDPGAQSSPPVSDDPGVEASAPKGFAFGYSPFIEPQV